MIEEFFVFLALGGAAVASVTDMKFGIIPNRLTFALIAVGVFGYLGYGLFSGNLSPFFVSLKSLTVMFVAGYLFWMLGAWSAGDVKEFMFIAALIPVYPAFLYGTFNPAIAYYPFVISVFINTLISIFPLIFVYSLYLSMKKKLGLRFIEPLKNTGKYLETSFLLVAAFVVSDFLDMRFITPLALLLLYKLNYRIVLSSLVILAYVLPLSLSQFYSKLFELSAYFLIGLLFIITISLLINSLNIIRKEALVEETKITDLKEGNIIAEEIYIHDGEILRDSRSIIEKIIDAAKIGSYQTLFQRKNIVGTGAAGTTKEEIELLRRYVKDGKLEDRVKIKKSMPFAPVILAGLIISLLIGDLMLTLKMWLYG